MYYVIIHDVLLLNYFLVENLLCNSNCRSETFSGKHNFYIQKFLLKIPLTYERLFYNFLSGCLLIIDSILIDELSGILHGAQITPPPLFLIFSFYAYFRLGKG